MKSYITPRGICDCGNSTTNRRKSEWICERCRRLEATHGDWSHNRIDKACSGLPVYTVRIPGFQ